MRVRVKEDEVPFVGRRGEIKEVPDEHGRTLVLLNKVEEVVGHEELEAQPVATPTVATDAQRKQRRRYNRRDMGAEPR